MPAGGPPGHERERCSPVPDCGATEGRCAWLICSGFELGTFGAGAMRSDR